MDREQLFEALRRALPALHQEFGLGQLAVFGSYARGTPTEASDVDILAEFERPIGLRFVEFAERIEGIVGRHVDVLTPAGLADIRNHAVAQRIRDSLTYI